MARKNGKNFWPFDRFTIFEKWRPSFENMPKKLNLDIRQNILVIGWQENGHFFFAMAYIF